MVDQSPSRPRRVALVVAGVVGAAALLIVGVVAIGSATDTGTPVSAASSEVVRTATPGDDVASDSDLFDLDDLGPLDDVIGDVFGEGGLDDLLGDLLGEGGVDELLGSAFEQLERCLDEILTGDGTFSPECSPDVLVGDLSDDLDLGDLDLGDLDLGDLELPDLSDLELPDLGDLDLGDLDLGDVELPDLDQFELPDGELGDEFTDLLDELFGAFDELLGSDPGN